MHTFNKSSELTLHVFLQDDLWQWGITCVRLGGVGAKVVAYSDPGFCSEQQARAPTANAHACSAVIAPRANAVEGEGHVCRREVSARIGRQVDRARCAYDGACDGVQSHAFGSKALRARWYVSAGRMFCDRLLPAR
jgi:hypothetical protein